jgi:hypothetical protein
MAYLTNDLKRRVRERFQNCCAYCRSPQSLIPVTFEFDHITPESAGGETTFANLCFACPSCNSHKHDAVSAVDSATGEVVALFHPHQDQWHEHFAWDETKMMLLGQTSKARATIERLQINRPALVELRSLWVAFGKFPPKLEAS